MTAIEKVLVAAVVLLTIAVVHLIQKTEDIRDGMAGVHMATYTLAKSVRAVERRMEDGKTEDGPRDDS